MARALEVVFVGKTTLEQKARSEGLRYAPVADSLITSEEDGPFYVTVSRDPENPLLCEIVLRRP